MNLPRFVFVAGALLASVTAISPRVEAGIIVNGGFEAGDLTGWSANDPLLVTAEFSVDLLGETGTVFPYENDYFAYLRTGLGIDEPTTLEQTFAASAGDVLSFAAFFDSGDDLNDDYGFARLFDAAGSLVAELYYQDAAGVPPLGSQEWQAIDYAIAEAGTYTIRFGVANVSDNDSAFDIALGVDAVTITTTAIPEPSSLALCGTAALAGLARRRRARTAPRA